MQIVLITEEQIKNRKRWIEEIGRLGGDFGDSAKIVERKLSREFQVAGIQSLLGHLRLCGAIPESFGHDSSEEKLYSKYTDAVIHQSYAALGLTSRILSERASSADVECVAHAYSFVADAKAFRLSRTAKNQKDFKVEAMDSWKYGKPYAMIVCPVYQMPSRQSQIYEQATTRSVCISTYTHLAVLARFAQESTKERTVEVLLEVFRAIEAMNPSRDAAQYWQTVNRTLLAFDHKIKGMWREEKIASNEAVLLLKREALTFLALERTRIMRLSKDEAISEVLKWRKLDSRIDAVNSVAENGILNLG